MKLIDNLNDIIPLEQQVYTINGDKQIDQKQVLKDVLKKLRKGELAVSYLFSQSSLSHGRQYAYQGRSVQSLSRVLRHSLCHKTYRDFDIQNCHPTIALHYCKNMKKWDVPYLERYVLKREEVIGELLKLNPHLDRETIKTAFLSILNGGSVAYYSITNKSETLTGMFYEIRDVFGKIVGLEENADLVEEVRATKKDDEEVRRSVCNKVLIDIEDDILRRCIDWLKVNNLDTRSVVLMFDGFMLPKTIAEKMPDNWADLLSDYVAENSSSQIRVKFLEKPMDEGVDLDKYELKSVYNENLTDLLDDTELINYACNMSDALMCDLICGVFKDRFRSENKVLYYFKNHRWNSHGDDVFHNEVRKISPLFDNLIQEAKHIADTSKEDGDIEYLNTLKRAKKSFELSASIKKAKDFVMSAVHCKGFVSSLDSISGIIGFENGVWDLRGDVKVFRDGLPEDLVSLTTGYKYDKLDNVEIAEKFIRSIVSPQTYKPLIETLGSFLIGGNPEDKNNFFVGLGSNGKTLLCNALNKVLGEYSRNIDKEVYTKEKGKAGGAEPHLMELKGRLMGLTSETDETDVFIASNFKTFSSNDTKTTRNCFDRNQTVFKPLYKPIIQTNHKPKFSSFDYGVIRRIRIFTFPYQFADIKEDEYAMADEGDEKDEEGYKVVKGVRVVIRKPRDITLSKTLEKPEVLCQFIRLMINNITTNVIEESDEMKQALTEYINELNPLTTWFEKRLIEDKETQPIKVSVLKKDYNSYSTSNMSDVKFSEYLRKKVEVNTLHGCKVIRGYKLKVEKEEED